jgi:hypothetical protein
VQERRAYIPQGWSKPYEFSLADLRSGADIIELSCKAGSQGGRLGVPWQYLHGLLESAIYGGRVDNRCDMKVEGGLLGGCGHAWLVWASPGGACCLVGPAEVQLHGVIMRQCRRLGESCVGHAEIGSMLSPLVMQACSSALCQPLTAAAQGDRRHPQKHIKATDLHPAAVQVLVAYLHQLFRPEVLGHSGKPSPLPGSRLMVPSSTRREDFLAAIAALPEADSPALFGLPANIERSVQQSSSERVLAQLRQMSTSKAAAAGARRDVLRIMVPCIMDSQHGPLHHCVCIKS